MIRLGLCCKFLREPIKFNTTTATYLLRLKRSDAIKKVSALCLSNSKNLYKALEYCSVNQIGSFRVTSEILPVKTHPKAGYSLKDLPDYIEIINNFQLSREFAQGKSLRLTFHPDQFVVLSSKDAKVIKRSILDLEYHAEVAELIGADVINIHGGGAYGDKKSALRNIRKNMNYLSEKARMRLSIENDERTYTPVDLLELCKEEQIPFVYDIHHHRCLPDGLSVEYVTSKAIETWNREPLFHISSPRNGWHSKTPSFHHNYINPKDFPLCWINLNITLEIEAKAKELAIKRLQKFLYKHHSTKGN